MNTMPSDRFCPAPGYNPVLWKGIFREESIRESPDKIDHLPSFNQDTINSAHLGFKSPGYLWIRHSAGQLYMSRYEHAAASLFS